MTSVSGPALVAGRAGARVVLSEALVSAPGPSEARVRLEASGLCHTDIMVAQGEWWDQFPYVLGHEGVGIVESVGSSVDEHWVGRRALLAWRSSCGSCKFCREGRTTHCAQMPQAALGALRVDGRVATPSLRTGTHSAYAVVAVPQLVEVPMDLPAASLALIGCGVLTGYGAVHNTANVSEGQSVLVIGCGSVGLNVLQAAAQCTTGPIVAADTNPAKVELALSYGATHAFNSRESDVAERVRDLTGGRGVDHAFDVVALAETMDLAAASCDVGANLVVVGTPLRSNSWTARLGDLFHRRISIRNSNYGDCIPSRDVPLIVAAYRSGALDLDSMVTETVELSEAADAIERLGNGFQGVRIVLRMPPAA